MLERLVKVLLCDLRLSFFSCWPLNILLSFLAGKISATIRERGPFHAFPMVYLVR